MSTRALWATIDFDVNISRKSRGYIYGVQWRASDVDRYLGFRMRLALDRPLSVSLSGSLVNCLGNAGFSALIHRLSGLDEIWSFRLEFRMDKIPYTAEEFRKIRPSLACLTSLAMKGMHIYVSSWSKSGANHFGDESIVTGHFGQLSVQTSCLENLIMNALEHRVGH